MATSDTHGSGDVHSHRPRRGRLRGQPTSTDQEVMRIREQEAQERRDRATAKELQEQYDVLAQGAARLAARSPSPTYEPYAEPAEDQGRSSPETLSDAEMARRLQIELDEQAAAELMTQEQDDTDSGARDQGHTPTDQGRRQRRQRSRDQGQAGPGGFPAMAELAHRRNIFSPEQWFAIQQAPGMMMMQMATGRLGLPMRWNEPRSFDGGDYEDLWDMAEQLGEVRQRGLNTEEIDSLPTCKFSKGHAAASQPSHQGTSASSASTHQGPDEGSLQCKVCLSDFEEGESIRTLPCLHRYHTQCIDRWIKRNAVCPVCRSEIKDEIHGAASH